ncbi:MAG TPA: carboxypeptidase regulatory-like domain-containing protein [Acidobacteriaceae bacterium]|nr:carboxypeptidase regulatory-like domain-containing protein [Acidobacteriaceae bacterium]
MKKTFGVLLAVQLVFAWGLLSAQNISSSIIGNVTDQQGAAIPGAQITVRNSETGTTVKAVSDAQGTYSVPAVLAGVYTVSVRRNGFETSRTDGVRVFSAQTKRVNVRLSVGAVQQTVTVTDEAPMISTDSMTIGDSVTASQLANLPTSQQTVDAFVSLAPGVQSSGDATNPEIAGGSHWGSVNYTLNGVEVNDPGNSGAVTVQGAGMLVLPPPSSIQELNVQSGNMGAKYSGHSSVTLVTKGGTNAFHGLAYEYLQNTILNANSFLLNAAGKTRPPVHLNQFGGNIGGPFWRNKAFFFFDYNGYRNKASHPVQLSLPGMKMRSGDFSDLNKVQLYDPSTGQPFPNNQIPESMIAPQAKMLLKYLPAPTVSGSPGLPSGGINYVVAVPITQNVDALDARVDYNISSSDRVFGVFARRVADPWNSATNYPTDYGQGRYGYKDTSVSGTETHTFNQTTINELRLAWGDYGTKFSGQNQDVNPQTLFPQMPATIYRGLPTMTISGYTGMFHDYGTGFYTPRWNVEITDNFTHIQGRHTIEAGIDETGYKINSRVPSTGSATGSFSFNGNWTGNLGWPNEPHSAGNAFADFLLGDANGSTTAPVGAFAQNIYSRDWGVYVQDTWQTTPRLTLIYGLRYEYQNPWLYKRQQVTTFDMKNDKLVLPENSATPTLPPGASQDLFDAYPIETTQSIGLPLHYIQPDRNNFAPRVGFAFRPFANGHTVIRGGFGTYYNFQPGFVGSRADAYNPPWQFSISESFTSKLPGKPKSPYMPDITFADPYPGTNGKSIVTPNPTIDMLQWDFQNAYMQEWSLTVEHEFGRDWSARASYLGHIGRHLPYNFGPINVPDVQIPNEPLQAQRPFQPFGAINDTRSIGKENFNQMQLGLQKRFSQGFSVQAQYQYSKGLDDVPQSGGPQRWQHPEMDYGNSVGLARHWLTFNYVYALPLGRGQQFLHGANGLENAIIGGWQVAGISAYHTGEPFSVNFSQTGTKFIGWWGGRADRVPGVSLTTGRSHSHDILHGVPWYNTAAFAPPQPWQWGNSARDLLFGPGAWNWDMSGSKTFDATERVHMEFRADFFDAFNHFNLGNPVMNISDTRDGGTPVANSGEIVSGSGQRSIQLSLTAKF